MLMIFNLVGIQILSSCASTNQSPEQCKSTTQVQEPCISTTQVQEPCVATQEQPPPPFVQNIADTALSFEMIGIPSGEVSINTSEGVKEIGIEPLWMGQFEVTWDIYDVFCLRLDRRRSAEGSPADAVTRPSKPYLPPDRGFGHNGYPAISISLHGAQSFCNWLSLKTGRTYRLPTQAEWQHACALGMIDLEALNDHAWHFDNADYTTHPVGSKEPDALDLFDMCGNVAEWCLTQDGQGLVMGGSFLDSPQELGCATRVEESSSWNESDPQIPKGQWWLADASFIGFRVVCEQ